MRAGQETIQELRAKAREHRWLRLGRELANGLGLGLIMLCAHIAEDALGSRVPELSPAALGVLLLWLPLGYALVMLGFHLLLSPLLSRHYHSMLAGSELLLWVMSGSLPPEQSALAARLRSGSKAMPDFDQRLRAALANWQGLCHATGFTPWPFPWLGWGPVLLALGWTGVAALVGTRIAFSPLIYPAVFILLAMQLGGQLLRLGREQFLLALTDDLQPDHPSPQRLG